MKPAIEIQELGKKYNIRKHEPYLAFRDTVANSIKNVFRGKTKNKEEFWALRDINLNIEQGERIGIIGKNGAGKSTLLKILSRVTWPTTGKAIIRGRLASLLEVGTGFHPELTGRENIYLNGSILGLKKIEIEKQFDAIVNFSGVEKFLDMPLKNYSSGMQLRLAFAVAAHLEPEILLIDEVLAVGDLEFQKKCLGKMEEVSTQLGRTILFVSHNMNYITSLCTKGILLEKGRIIDDGVITSVVSNYISQITNRASHYIWEQKKQPGNDIVRLHSVRIIDNYGLTKSSFKVTERVGIEMNYKVMQDGHVLWLGHNIDNQFDINVFDTHNVNTTLYKKPHAKGEYCAIAWIPGNLLNTGSYYVSSAIFNHLEKIIHLHEKKILLFTVYDVFDEVSARGMSNDDFPGVVRPLLDWEINRR